MKSKDLTAIRDTTYRRAYNVTWNATCDATATPTWIATVNATWTVTWIAVVTATNEATEGAVGDFLREL